MPDHLLEVDGVRFAYRGHQALRGVDLSIAAGETCVLIGPNGAGKSTLVKTICGRLRPDAGSVRIGGRDPARDGQARRALAIVPQDIALYPALTVRENLAAFADLAGHAAAPSDIARALELTGTVPLARRRVGTLSGGEARRANIAAALTGRPALLLLDEPTVGVDASARALILDTLRGLGRDGVAILLITHDLEFGEVSAGQVAILVEGRTARAGTLAALLQREFGAGAVEVAVRLPEPPAGDLVAALGRLGFVPTDGDLVWSTVSRTRDEAAALQAGLASDLSPTAEIRLRGAGLAALARRAYAAPDVRP